MQVVTVLGTSESADSTRTDDGTDATDTTTGRTEATEPSGIANSGNATKSSEAKNSGNATRQGDTTSATETTASGSGTDAGDTTEDARIRLGVHRARDGTTGGPVRVDAERPHAAVIVGKRGTGKSHTLGVVAEGLADAPGVTPTVVDPMGEFGGVASDGSQEPRIRATAVPPRVWPELVGIERTTPAGGLIWDVMAANATLAEGMAALPGADADSGVRRVARTHLSRAQRWDVFDPAGLTPTTLTAPGVTVFDCAGLPPPATNAVALAVARGCYERRLAGEGQRLPWLLFDEAHGLFDGIAARSLRRLFTRGRTPGVSVVCATQRPARVPAVAFSQADLLIAHAVDAGRDTERLADARPRMADLRARLPAERGTALVADRATPHPVVVRVRERRMPHGGASPTASAFAGERDSDSGSIEASAGSIGASADSSDASAGSIGASADSSDVSAGSIGASKTSPDTSGGSGDSDRLKQPEGDTPKDRSE